MADGGSPPVGREWRSSWQSRCRQCRCSLPAALAFDVLLEDHLDRWHLRWCHDALTLGWSQISRRLTPITVIIRFRPGYRDCACCSSMLCVCRSATLCVRVVRSMTQGALSQIVQGYVRDGGSQHVGEDQGGPPYPIELETLVLLNSLVRASPDKNTCSQ